MGNININFSEISEYKASKLIFDYFEIKIDDKTYWELIDEVDSKLQSHLKLFQKKYGEDYLLKFKTDLDTILLQTLLTHLAQIHQWGKN